MKKGILVLIFVVLVLAGGAFALTNKASKPAAPGNSSESSTSDTAAPVTDQNTEPTEQGTTITYSDDGFSPATLTVKAGTTITIKNTSGMELQFSSDDHPTHTKNPEMNETAISSGQTQSLTMNKKGTWGYHNHLSSGDTGTIVVE
jgi:plastocyanin